MEKFKSLSELFADQQKKDKESLNNSPDKNVNYYYEDKKRRIAEGIEEEIIINEDEPVSYTHLTLPTITAV